MSDPGNPVVVATAATEIEAGVIVSALEAEGITARTVGTFTSSFRAEAPGRVSIVVRQDELERAQQVLAQAQGETSE